MPILIFHLNFLQKIRSSILNKIRSFKVRAKFSFFSQTEIILFKCQIYWAAVVAQLIDAVVSNTTDRRFESSLWQNVFTIECNEITKRKLKNRQARAQFFKMSYFNANIITAI